MKMKKLLIVGLCLILLVVGGCSYDFEVACKDKCEELGFEFVRGEYSEAWRGEGCYCINEYGIQKIDG